MSNIILMADSYKYSQFNQYPEGTTGVYSYIESRGGKYPYTVFFGLQMFLKEYLVKPITWQDIDDASQIIEAHGLPFNRDGWLYILREHNGKLPVRIRAVPEGKVIPTGNVLVTIENTDPECAWLTSFLETALLKAVWYPTTVATNSYHSKQIIKSYLEETGDPSLINFKLHDFGYRGVSSEESAAIGGVAHLVNFMGTDTIPALVYARRYYGADMAGFSIPAMEHSTVTSWGREGEVDSYRNMLTRYGKPGSLLACVSDSYDIFQACIKWGTELKQQVIDSGATVVIRPDSGDPVEVVISCLDILGVTFGYTENDKGYKVLPSCIRLIWGDGINHASIRHILEAMKEFGFSADNIAFGQGGALLQAVDRDTQKWAMKCSAAKVNGKWIPVFKDPVTDPGKKSKAGRVTLYRDFEGNYSSGVEDWPTDCLWTVFEDGELINEITFDNVRANANGGA